MSLQHSSGEPEPFLDAETAARALGLAAQLQGERDARVGLSDLRLAAAEAGIAPELLDEALRRVEGHEPRKDRTIAFGLRATAETLGLVALSLVYLYVHMQGSWVAWEGPGELSWWVALLAAMVAALFAPRQGWKRTWVPLLVAGSWVGMAITLSLMSARNPGFVAGTDLTGYLVMGLAQFLTYALGTGLRTGVDRLRAHAPVPTGLQRD